jgi:hypothetical protein
MKTPTLIASLRGLLASALLLTAATASELQDEYNFGKTLWDGFFLVPDVGWPIVAPFDYTLTEIETAFANPDGRILTVELWDGIPSKGGTLLRTADFPAKNTSSATFAPVELLGGHTYFVGFKNIGNPAGTVKPLTANVSTSYANVVNDFYYDTGSGVYDLHIARADDPTDFIFQPILAFLGPTLRIVAEKGTPVPGVMGATFTSVGVPQINSNGELVYLGKWSGGAGIFSFLSQTLVAQVGQEVTPGVTIKSMKDPLVDAVGAITFPATLQGASITSANDSAILTTASGDLYILAQEGTPAPDAPPGALWKSFTSVAVTDYYGVLILGTMAQGSGGITAANDTGLWSIDPSGVAHLVLQEGTTVLRGKTVKSFVALTAVSGSPGQTRAFRDGNLLAVKVTFTDGHQAVVALELPQVQ